jgi:RNA polymerase sigma-70 factor (ECF subfamily)
MFESQASLFALLLTCRVRLKDPSEGAFVAEITPDDRSRLTFGLKDQIDAATARGRSAFPHLLVDDEIFALHLARALKRMSDSATLADLAAEDLYLACACLTGAAIATTALMARHADLIRRTVERLAGKSNADEIIQELFSRLLVGSVDSPPEIVDYAGRGPLARWLEVVAERAALMWLRTERRKANVAERAAMEPRPVSETSPEAVLFRERHEIAFEQALKEALQRVPTKDRAILRLHFVDDVSTEKIGKMLGVSQPTASRWLKKVRSTILTDLKLILRREINISSSEIESLASLATRRLDLSITQLLKESTR